MNAFQRYGMDAMGVAYPKALDQELIEIVQGVFGAEQDTGWVFLDQALDEFYVKAEKLTDRLVSATMFTSIKATPELTEKYHLLQKMVFEAISKYWKYDLVLEGNVMKLRNKKTEEK